MSDSKTIVITNANDLEKLRSLGDAEKVTIFLLNNINMEGNFTPIELPNTSIVIYGLKNAIYNLKVNTNGNMNAGLFSSVKDLYIKNLVISKANICGGESCGIVAGYVNGVLDVDGLDVDGVIFGDAVCGGLVAHANDIRVKNSIVLSTLTARGYLGGIAASAKTCKVDDSIINATFKPTALYPEGKALIDQYVAYLDSKESPRVEAIAYEVNKYLEKQEYQRRLYNL